MLLGIRFFVSSWEALAGAEEQLRQREQGARAAQLGPEELLALADEREKLAVERDALADADDEAARGRDATALQRDVMGSGRDRSAREYANDLDRGAVHRFLAGSDRDYAAGDRTDSGDDRGHGSDARHRAADDRQRATDDRNAAAEQAAALRKEAAGLREALNTRLVIGQAEGLLMTRHNIDPDAAFRLMVKLSQEAHVRLRDVAQRIVGAHTVAATARTPPDGG